MKSVRSTPAWMVCILLAAFALVTVGASAPPHGRPFTGFYDLSGVQEQGDLVQLTLHVKLFNQTSQDVSGVIITLVEPPPTMMLRGNFAPVKVWKSEKFIQMKQEFTVSKRAYQEWTAAGQPELVVLFQDADGKSWQITPQVRRSPLAN
jgi:hypothetical protein